MWKCWHVHRRLSCDSHPNRTIQTERWRKLYQYLRSIWYLFQVYSLKQHLLNHQDNLIAQGQSYYLGHMWNLLPNTPQVLSPLSHIHDKITMGLKKTLRYRGPDWVGVMQSSCHLILQWTLSAKPDRWAQSKKISCVSFFTKTCTHPRLS